MPWKRQNIFSFNHKIYGVHMYWKRPGGYMCNRGVKNVEKGKRKRRKILKKKEETVSLTGERVGIRPN